MDMRIHNIRMGFATNSSSTHSIVYIPGGARDDHNDGQRYGWVHFTAAGRESKLGYLAQIIAENLDTSDDIRALVASEWSGVKYDQDGHIDHQSSVMLPRDWSGKGIDRAFVADLRAMFERDDVVILGGNDNDGVDHPLADMATRTMLTGLSCEAPSRSTVIGRRDGAHWVLFSRGSGMKVRVSLDPAAGDYTKAAAPELVDLKITDKCTHGGCSYCYQGSTPAGKHAPMYGAGGIYAVVQALANLRVFEVAIGGGEPTEHPDFIDILEVFERQGVVPNFTTRNLEYLRDEQKAKRIAEVIGGFAVSVDERTGFEAPLKLRDGPLGAKMSIQYVIGTGSDAFLGALVKACHERGVRLTLLGYKTTGRGASALRVLDGVQARQTETWIDVVRGAVEWPRIGIDTTLAAQSEARLRDAGVSAHFYTTKEGDFSCYVDAVAGTIAPSSYCNPSLAKAIAFDADTIRSTFATF